MSSEDLHDVASKETPDAVKIPQSWSALIVWAVGRFGVGILMAGVFAYGLQVVYQDMRADRAELMEAYRESITVMDEVGKQLELQTHSIEDLKDACAN